MSPRDCHVSRRGFMGLVGSGAAGLLAGRLLGEPLASSAAAASRPARRPNIVLILADDLGYGDVGCYGTKAIPTPNIDALAAGGLRFTDGYVTAPVCSPSRAGLLTGRYQQRFGHETNAGETTPERLASFGLPIQERTLGNDLQAAGYVTGLVGKWHLGMAEQFHPLRRGFTECYAFLAAWHNYINLDRDARPIFRNNTPAKETADYLTDGFTREGCDFIQRHRDEPFFLFQSYSAPHAPLQATPKYLDRFKSIADETRRTYCAMVSALDDGVGAILAKLRELRLEENTLVFFLSDNGCPITETPGSNAPLNGRKGQMFEGGIRVPFIACWKGHIAPGVCREPVTTLDLLPTSLAAAGAEIPKERPIDGVDLLPLLSGRTAALPPRELFWRMGTDSAIRKGNWKLIRTGPRAQLFDLAADAGESKDLAKTKTDVLGELLADYTQWESRMKKP